MRTVEEIEEEMKRLKESLKDVKGRETEVYSRIVGYYRSIRNWNKGRVAEYQQRKEFVIPTIMPELSDRLPIGKKQ